jgi:putative FmdB family regulatory protein
MPTYEYGCTACGSEWEEVQRITAAPLEVCPKCGKSSAHRLISAGGGFILKGGGWYSDLYSSAKPASNKADANGTTSTDTGTKDGGSKAESTSEKPASGGTEAKAADTKASTPTAPSTPSSPTTPASST